jgi:choice-of-anchor B domain-containing protein
MMIRIHSGPVHRLRLNFDIAFFAHHLHCMKKLSLLFILAFAGIASAQNIENFNIEELAHYTFGAQELNDIWGYVDEEGNEYAIVGRASGVSIIDVTDENNLQSVGEFSGNTTIWRDIKTWNDHAYVTCDACGNGLLIIDLSPLPSSTSLPYTYWLGDTFTFQSAHNLYIDENGFAYIFGSNHSAGGAVILDLNQDPMAPVEVGKYDQHYFHDGVVRGDTMWGAAIYVGEAQVVDVSDKANPVLVSSWKTPDAFTHNLWFSDDNHYLFTTDEVNYGKIGAYDVSDVFNPTEVDVWQAPDETTNGIIIHNTHFMDDFLVTSHYTIGVSIVSTLRKNNLLEVGRYDTSPDYHEEGFHGCWGAYPWLPSGKLLATDIEDGLYVLKPAYLHGCYLEGQVYDMHTGDPIFFPSITLIEDSLETEGDIVGDYELSLLDSGTYSLKVSADGYFETVVEGVVLKNGQVTIQDVGLSNWPAGISEKGWQPNVAVYPNPAKELAQVRSTEPIIALRVFSANGAEMKVNASVLRSNAVDFNVQDWDPGVYLIELQGAAHTTHQRLVVCE